MFIIVKQTTNTPATLTPNMAYAGPACSWAGVEPGNQYNDRKIAEVDAAYLQRSSSAEFKVVELA